MLEQPVLQDLLGAELIAAMHHGHLGGEVGEEQRLLDRGVAAADHEHFLVLVEEAVAGGAGGHAVTLEPLLRGQIEPARLRAGRQHHGLGHVDVAAVADQPERPARQVEIVDVVGDDPGADMLGLLLHLLHQPGSLDDVGEARIVLHVGGDGELAARLDALDQHRLQHGAGRIDRGGVAGRSGADNDNLGMGGLGHRSPNDRAIWTGACGAAAGRLRHPPDPNLRLQTSHARYATLNSHRTGLRFAGHAPGAGAQ